MRFPTRTRWLATDLTFTAGPTTIPVLPLERFHAPVGSALVATPATASETPAPESGWPERSVTVPEKESARAIAGRNRIAAIIRQTRIERDRFMAGLSFVRFQTHSMFGGNGSSLHGSRRSTKLRAITVSLVPH